MTAYKLLLQELLAAEVRFLIVGGYAAIAHGLTRATDDLDVWVEPTRDNVERMIHALQRAGIPTSDLSIETIADPYTFLRVGEEKGRKVDIMAGAGGEIQFVQAWPNRFETEFFGLAVPFLGLQDLIAIKTAIGRHKDLADVESLCAFHGLDNSEEN